MKHGANLLFSFILFVGDFLALVTAFSLAYVIRVKLDDRPLLEPITANGYIAVIALLLVFWLIVFSILGLYRSQVFENRFKEAFLLFIGSFIGIQFLIGSEYVLNRAIFPARLVTVYGFIFAFLLTLLVRTIARALRRFLFRFDIGVSRVLLVGATNTTKELAHRLSQNHSGYSVVGVVGDVKSISPAHVPKSKRFASFEQATKSVNPSDVSSIVQTELFADSDKNNEIMTFAQENHIAYRFIPGNSRLFVGNIDVNLFEDIPMIAVHQTALIGWGRIVKRLFDLIVSAVLAVLLAPLLVLIYGIIRLVDGGQSPIYRQERLTRFNASIHIYKFRSFRTSVNNLPADEALDKVGQHKLAKRYRAGDDSVPVNSLLHPLGNFLRKTSLDELPQIINVLKGDLSLVGPRPLVPREINNYAKKNIILSVKPGVTGLAAISGRRNIPFEERRKLDMYYVQNWSFLLDIIILFKTAVVVMRRAFIKGNVE